MDEILMKTVFQLKRGLAEAWARVNPVLRQGEPGFELDTGKLKIGNGTNNWNELPYLVGDDEGALHFKGSVNTKNDLPTENNEIGDIWQVIDESKMYVWNISNDWEVFHAVDVTDAISAVLGDPITDTAESNTVYGVKKKAEANATAITELQNSKVGKITAGPSTYQIIYGTKKATTDSEFVDNWLIAGTTKFPGITTVPMYDDNSCIQVGNPQVDFNAANKKYVDDKIATKLDKVVTKSVDLSAFEIINSNSENQVTNNTVTMTFGGTVTIGCKNKIVGFTITGDLDTGSIPVVYNDSVIQVNQTPQTIEPVLMTTDLVINNSAGILGGTFTFSDMVIKTEVTPDKYYTQESLFVESNTAKIIDKNLKTTDFDVTWQGSYSGDFHDTPNSDLNLQITYDSFPVILFPKGDLAGKEYNLEYNTNASIGAPSMRIYTSAEDTTGTLIEVSSEHNNFYTGKIYKIEIGFGLNASVNMTLKTKVSQMGFMSAEDKLNLANLQTQVGDVSTALDSILTIQNNLLGGNS